MQKTHMITAFALGAAVGSAAALLAAPARGETTRRKIRKTARDLTEDTKSAVGGTVSDIGEKARAQKSAVTEAASAAREAYREEMQDGSSA